MTDQEAHNLTHELLKKIQEEMRPIRMTLADHDKQCALIRQQLHGMGGQIHNLYGETLCATTINSPA
jgi:hypothetical protein